MDSPSPWRGNGGFASRKSNGFSRTPLATCKQLVNTLSTVSRWTRGGVGRPYRSILFKYAVRFLSLWRNGRRRAGRCPHYQGFTVTLGKLLPDEWSTRRRDLYLTTHNTHKRQIFMSPEGFETGIPASVREQIHAFTPRGHRDRPVVSVT
jgi:hypothetical protein